jgi:hypothetical protein
MTISKEAKLILLMMRCEYLECQLTDKGRGFFPPQFWRLWNRILCSLSTSHKKAVIELLELSKRFAETQGLR